MSPFILCTQIDEMDCGTWWMDWWNFLGRFLQFFNFFFSVYWQLCVVMSNSELATGYAALILADEGLDISADKLITLTKSAGIEVEAIWAQLFAKALEGKDVKDLLLNTGGTTLLLLSTFSSFALRLLGAEMLIIRWSSFCCCTRWSFYCWRCRCSSWRRKGRGKGGGKRRIGWRYGFWLVWLGCLYSVWPRWMDQCSFFH